MRTRIALGIVALAAWGLVGSGCDTPPPACEPLCGEALAVVEGCLDEWDQAWGEGLGYTDPADFDNWCATFLFEQQQLAIDRDGPEQGRSWVDGVCADQREALAGGDCAAYAGSWAMWEPGP